MFTFEPMHQQAVHLLTSSYAEGAAPRVISVPGRVNLIGEHIDYHSLPVLPMAIQRHVSIAFRVREDSSVRAVSSLEPLACEFSLAERLQPGGPGEWKNYLKAAAAAVQTRWLITRGIDAAVASDLPAAAGLSSSSALLAGFAIALLQANGIQPTIEGLMAVLPEGEHFVGTRGGGMDHAAVLAARRGCALLIRFAPFSLFHIAIPSDWCFLVAHSLTTAEKSGAARVKYNALREQGVRALQALKVPTFQEAMENYPPNSAIDALSAGERQVFRHVITESRRVLDGSAAIANNNIIELGCILAASHASLREDLGVSTPAIDALVEAALEAGALGARLTGAGFGGCVIALCTRDTCLEVRKRLMEGYYSGHSDFDAERHLFIAEPSDGALAG